ncbi:hypothetical protein BC832DRAFT_555639 [Gaertneriomyces semiglobifer]|nr:hypothetical protein BC832DRAFT_555639 [Gaertneriomyces semiglobifer]
MNGQRALRSAAHKVCRHQLGRALPSASYRRLFVSEKQFHSSPSVAAQSLRGGLGGIFDSLELPPGLFDDVPGVVTKKQKAPIDDGRAVPTEDLLPSHAVLRKLYDENRIQLAPKELVEFVDVVRKIVTSQPLDKIKLENTVMKLASGNVGDVTSIGVMLVRHSKAGAPLGIRLLEVATKKGDMDAEHQYAQLLCQDIAGAEKNVKKALNHMRRLAEKNHARSQYIMGLRYIFTASDMKGGLAFLESAAAAGIAEAACQLGIIYWQGLEGWVPQNIERGLKYLNQAHEAGLTEATFALGEYYRKLDTTSDIKTAFELYTAADFRSLKCPAQSRGNVSGWRPCSGYTARRPSCHRVLEDGGRTRDRSFQAQFGPDLCDGNKNTRKTVRSD